MKNEAPRSKAARYQSGIPPQPTTLRQGYVGVPLAPSSSKQASRMKAKGNKFITIGLVQTKMTKNLSANMLLAQKMVTQAAKEGAKIICLPELYRSPYFPQYKKQDSLKFAETTRGESYKSFSRLANKLKVIIIVPIFEINKNGKFFNSALVINENGKPLPVYRKLHIPQDPGFYEKNYFAAGDLGYRIYKTKLATFAVLICFDQWFPEAARIARLKGAEIIFYPTAIGHLLGYTPPEGNWHEAWETVQRGHAIANSLIVAAVNRVGQEDKLMFWGQSFICDPFGKIINKASSTKPQVLTAKLNLTMNESVSQGWGFLRNRRPDTYQAITKK